MGNDNLAKGTIDEGEQGEHGWSVEELEETLMGMTRQGWAGFLRERWVLSGWGRRASMWSSYWVRKRNWVKRVSRDGDRVGQDPVPL